MSQQEILGTVRSAAREQDVNEELAVAICIQESMALHPKCGVRYEPSWRYYYKAEEFAERGGISVETEMALQRMSLGPMHVMGSVARELGFKEPLLMLFSPVYGIQYGVKKLKQLCEKYESEEAVISAYNAGSLRKVNGAWSNQKYVDSVMARLRRLRAIE